MEIDFIECPVVYINEYYEEKMRQIDISCEKAILLDDKEKDDLNTLRFELQDQIKIAKNKVFDRYHLLQSKFSQPQSKINELKDEIFMDNYCIVFNAVKETSIFEFKCGILIFSQYDDEQLRVLGYLKFFYFFKFNFI